MTDRTTALIAGAGGLPAAVAARLENPVICALSGLAPEGLETDLTFHFERLAPFLRSLSGQGVQRVGLVGAIARPKLDPALFDRETAALVPALMAALQGGDDGALRWFIELIESYDMTVAGLTELAPDLLAGEGVLGARAPTPAEEADAARGRAILQALDAVDVAQGCVVASGLCLAVESIYGTDAMLGDVARHRPEREPQKGGVFTKRAKAGQDLRVDLPTIGPDTVTAAQAAGLTGIALEAGKVVLFDRPALIAAADAAGIAVWASS